VLPGHFGFWTTLYLVVTAILFGYSYIKVILLGPGYLPFYFPYANPNNPDRATDALSGMVTNSEQEFYVKNLKLPPRTRFFKSARRIVIRPDHLCSWTTSFIGKKNHKLFFLFNFWAVIYISGFTIATLLTIIRLAVEGDVVLQLIICVIYLFLGFSFAILTGNFAITGIIEISMNQTTFEGMKNISRNNKKSCIGNWEEVFGSRRRWYLWLLPISAFPTGDDRLLVVDDWENEKHPFL
jgi:hypothetical protein